MGALAAAGVAALLGGRGGALQREGIVVGDFLAGGDGADGFNVDAAALQDGFAIGLARVIDETGLVAIRDVVDDLVISHVEQKRVIVFMAFKLGPLAALALVFDEAGSLADSAKGKGALSFDGRGSYFNQG